MAIAELAREAGMSKGLLYPSFPGKHAFYLAVVRDLAEAMQRVAGEIEWAISQAPFQWFCFREVWPPDAQTR